MTQLLGCGRALCLRDSMSTSQNRRIGTSCSMAHGVHDSEDRIMETALAASLLLLAAVSPASATSPTDVVQAAAEQVVQVAEDPALAGPAAAERRRQEIQRIVENLFDFPEMTWRSLGTHWTDRSAQEREEFTRLFKGILEYLYFGKIENYSGQRIQYLS